MPWIRCWDEIPENRPDIDEVVEILETYKFENAAYPTAYPLVIPSIQTPLGTTTEININIINDQPALFIE